MKTFLRTALFIGIIILIVHTIVRMNHKPQASVLPPGATLHHAIGHLISSEALAANAQQHLCFSIDSFPELAESERNFYEIHEHAHVAAEGPRCRDFQTTSPMAQLKPGAPVDVLYSAENGAEITVRGVAAHSSQM